MSYQEILIDLIDTNPFQTRQEYDYEILAGIATSAMDDIGIRNPPLVRPHPEMEGRYQIASGHGRVNAWRTLGHETIMCRVEDLSDSQMKKEVLIENVNRADLNLISIKLPGDDFKQPSLRVIRETRGLPDEERILLIQKAQDRGWGGEVVLRVPV